MIYKGGAEGECSSADFDEVWGEEGRISPALPWKMNAADLFRESLVEGDEKICYNKRNKSALGVNYEADAFI